jgi:hypothetical protein
MNKVTRREFLEGTSATILASTSGSTQAQTAGPHFVPDGSGYALRSHNVNVFRLDPSLLVPGKIQVAATATKLLIVGLTEGDVRGLEFAIELSGNEWVINATWRFANLPTLTASVVAPSSPRNVTFHRKLDSRQLAPLVKHLSGNQIVCPKGAALQLHVGSQQTEIVANTGQDFSVFEKKLSGQRLLLAPLSRSARVQLVNARPSTLIDLAHEKHLQLQLRAARGATASFGHNHQITVDGPLELLIHSPRCETTHIPSYSASRALVGADQTWSINPTDGIWRLNTPRVSFEARVAEDGTAHPCARPIEVSTQDGKLKHFCIHTRLVSTGLALEHVDRTRFDLGDASLQVRHSPLPPPKSKSALPTPVFAYAAPNAVLRIPIPDGAKLRLWRGLDLFCLTFQFHNIDLSIGKKVQLIPLRPEQIDPASRPDEAVLLAEFPPQHIMERTFLRQKRPLPDAGKEVSPAQLRQLLRLEAGGIRPTSELTNCNFTGDKEPNPNTDSQCLRLAIQNEKIDAEKRDVLGDPAPTNTHPKDSYFPFASFAKAWDSGPEKHADKFGLWIGPAGLFTVEARRSARRFAEQLRLKRLNELLEKVEPQKFDKNDFADAAQILARPDFPMSRAEASDWVIKDRKGQSGQLGREHLKKLWGEGVRLSEDFRAFQKFVPNRDKAESHNWLLFPDWPFTDEELKSIYKKAGFELPDDAVSPEQREREMQKAIIKRLDEFKKEQSDTGDAPEGFRRPVEAWISEPSRLAFVMKGVSMGLTVAELTAWENFELRVVQRARRLFRGSCTKGDPFGETEESNAADILGKQGIAVGQEKTGVERIREVLNRVKEPEHFDTALEIPTGLILSPAQDAIWITPKKLPPRLDGSPDGTAPTPVWQARLLERKKAPSLRAIWSDNFALFARDTFLKESLTPEDLARLEKWEAPGKALFRTAMSPQDRAELVALTSMYGLPVIASKDKEVSSQIEPPSVDGKKYITDFDEDPKSPYAIYMPVPLRARRLALGATGAMLDLDTTFPLVTSARAKGPTDSYFKSFSLQRWRSLISDGSDVITVVVRRGYLFPLGHTASLVKVTEPRLRPIDPARPALGYSVEQATRIYIEVTRASHQYPAVGQSYEARDFQPRDITLLTLRTPDLVDPADDKPLSDPGKPDDPPENLKKKIDEILGQPAKAGPHGRIRGWVNRRDPQEIPNPGPLVGQLAGIVFWPRTEVGTRGTVRFRMRIDAQPTPVSMPLIFADHRAASDRATVKALTEYYRGEEVAETEKPADAQGKPKGKPGTEPEKGRSRDSDKPREWNKVQHNGALRTYADEQRKGQCTYVTDWQVVEAVKGDSNFAFNSELVAAEQPPFYPRLAMAQVRPQQIQGLTGSAAPVLHVEYEKNYVHNGFNPPESCGIADPDTFLRVTDDPLPKLDMGDHGDQGGTVARPAKIIYGLNRRFGIAGPPPPEFKDCSTLLDKKAGEAAAPAAPSPAPVAPGQTPAPPPAPAGQAPAPQPPAAPPVTNQPAAQPIRTQALPPVPACSAPDAPRKYDNKDLAIGHFGDDAKLFGLIKLRDFIAALTGELGAHIPQLEEITNFTGDELAKVAKALEGPIDSLTEQLKQNAGQLLFPDFTCALGTLGNELKRLRSIDSNLDEATKTARQIDAATAIWASGQRVVRELEAIARTPISQYAERLRYYLISSQGDIAKPFQTFAPWNEIQNELATLVAEVSGQVPDAVIVPRDAGANRAELENFVKQQLTPAVRQIEVWKSRSPLDEIAKTVGELPAGVTGLAEGPLYKLAAALVSLAQQSLGDVLEQKSLAVALKWAVDAIDTAKGIKQRIEDLTKLGSAACALAIKELRKLLQTVVDPSTARASAATKNIDDLAKAIKKTHDDISAGGFGAAADPMLAYLAEWHAAVATFATNLAGEIAKTQAIASSALGTLPGGITAAVLPNFTVCQNFGEATIRTVAALNTQRHKLLGVWFDFTKLLPNRPFPALPTGPTALQPFWRDVQRHFVTLLRSAMFDAEAFALRYATPAGQQLWNELTSELTSLVDALPGEIQTELKAALEEQVNLLIPLRQAQLNLEARLSALASAPGPDPATVQTLINELPNTFQKIADGTLLRAEAVLSDSVLRPAMASLLAKHFKPGLDKAAERVLAQIATVYQAIRTQRDRSYLNVRERLGSEQNQSTGIFQLIARLFGPPGKIENACSESWDKFILLVPQHGSNDCASETTDLLATETEDIRDNKRTAEDLRGVLERWQKGESAPQRILQHIEYFARVGVRSSITRVLDVDSLRQQIADTLAEALPTTRTLKSSLSLPLKETSVGIGTFRPIGNTRELTLGGTATIDLLNPTAPQTKVIGRVTPFELDILSIMTFTFAKGVTYSKEVTDGRGKITAPLGADDIKFGDKLSFLADLAKSLSFGGDGDGPYTIVHITNPSIEAGYRIGIPVITLGATFTNINFAGAIVLPFTSGSARVRAALGSLDNPFMISVGIYGGSGYMALEASPQGIEAFEAAFQFGGIASIGYGPLQGTAYVTTGAFVRKDQLGCTFGALFSAGFNAHIACFGISAAFTLRLIKRAGDSSISGEAALTFTFSIGRFIKVGYTIRVQRSMQAGFGGGGKEAAFLPGSGVQLAALGNFAPICFPNEQSAVLIIHSFSPEEDWSEFEAQFDPMFVPEAIA